MSNLVQQSNSLQDFLDQQEGVEHEAFTVKDDKAANWALRKMKHLQGQQEANNQLAQDEVDKIQAWNKEANDRLQRDIDYFQSLLANYAMEKRQEDPKFKKLELPNGKISFRKQQPQWDYDKKSIVNTLEESGLTDLIRVKKEPDATKIKKMLQIVNGQVINPETGEIVPGIRVIDREDAFKVEVN